MIRKHSGMFLLLSDFSRHFLVNLLSPAELRVFIKSHARILPNQSKIEENRVKKSKSIKYRFE
ncbi:MAG: hypothetical protein JSV46_09335 [Candidatus Aminicenantes bacterium]|nr:MAG: hypothetical protein JSV46_09335 [Candidatus Aminicenantes bacterium]